MVDGNGSTIPAAGAHHYDQGKQVNVRAIPDDGWQFDGWTGNVADPQAAATTITVTSDETVTANFSQVEYTLSLQITGKGTTTPIVGTHHYYLGEQASIQAVPGDGWQFDGWTGNVADPQAAATTIDVTSDETVTANFSQIEYTLSLAVSGNGTTTPAAGTHQYPEGKQVNVQAIPDDGWQFDGWTGNVTDPQAAATTITVTSDEMVTANFSQVEPVWWQVLYTIYEEFLAIFRSVDNFFTGTF